MIGEGKGREGSQGLEVKDFDQTEHDHLRAKREKRDGGEEDAVFKEVAT